MDGVGGAAARGAEEGVEMEGVGVSVEVRYRVLGGVQPFRREENGKDARGAWNGGSEMTLKERRIVDEKVELVGGISPTGSAFEGYGEWYACRPFGGNSAADTGRGYGHALQRAATDDYPREVDLAVGGDAVLVVLAEDGVGAVVLPHSLPVEPDEVGFFHVGREFGDHREGVAVGLLRLGLRVGHMGGHGTYALAPVPGVVYLVAEFAALG